MQFPGCALASDMARQWAALGYKSTISSSGVNDSAVYSPILRQKLTQVLKDSTPTGGEAASENTSPQMSRTASDRRAAESDERCAREAEEPEAPAAAPAGAPSGPIDTVKLELVLRASRTEEERLLRARVLQENALRKQQHDELWRGYVRTIRDEARANGVRLAGGLTKLTRRWREEGEDSFFAVQTPSSAADSAPSAEATDRLAGAFRLARVSDVVGVQKVPRRTTIHGTTFAKGDYCVLVRSVFEGRATPLTSSSTHGASATTCAPPSPSAAVPVGFEERRARPAALFTSEDVGKRFDIDEHGRVFVEKREREVEWGGTRPPRLSALVHSVDASGLKGHVTYASANGKVEGKMKNPPAPAIMPLRAVDLRALQLTLVEAPLKHATKKRPAGGGRTQRPARNNSNSSSSKVVFWMDGDTGEEISRTCHQVANAESELEEFFSC